MEPLNDDPKCKLCDGQPADWCYGCRSYICDDHADNPWGQHDCAAHDLLGNEDN